jgi:hypothetical protein
MNVYRAFALKPFGGVGVGMRRYSPTSFALDPVTKALGYGAIGLEAPFPKGGVRLGMRANISKFEGFETDAPAVFDRDSQKIDFAVEFGVRVRIR